MREREGDRERERDRDRERGWDRGGGKEIVCVCVRERCRKSSR